ncbi:MAG TPA: DinB family protein [Thermomicrobiales bacterium]|nr:DinB family protein [Thermomicrobiales bacterium]
MMPFARSIDTVLGLLSGQALAQLECVPEHDLNEWKPRQDLEDINTFYALATHPVAAGEYWILHAAGGRPLERDRPAEFRARGDLPSLKSRYERWLADARDVLSSLTEDDLTRIIARDADPKSGSRAVHWSVADCLIHAVEHTAVHVGHLQIQRQLWNAERSQS